MSAHRTVDPDLVVEQIDLSFRLLDDMARFLSERKLPDSEVPAPDRADHLVVAQILDNTCTAV